MSTPKKPRSDSALKILPAERQAAIAEYAAAHSLEETVAWLKQDGCKTSRSSLSEFLSWYALRAQMQKNESTVETLLADLSKSNPDWTPDQIQAAGQSFFTALALQQQDPKQWHLIQQTNLKREQLSLDKNKFEFDAAKACLAKLPQLKAISTNKELSDDQKLEQARLALFGSAPQ
jgi:hypothetical protein